MRVLITGKPGIGKTTVIKKVINGIPDRTCGFYTEDYRDISGKRKGFRIFTTDGLSHILAEKGFRSKFKVGSYGIDVEGFEKIVIPLLERCMERREKILVIDEIGKMELFSKRFADLIKSIFRDEKRDIIATVPIKDVHPVVRWIKNLPDTVVISLNSSNRDEVPDRIIDIFQRSSSQSFDKS